VATGRRRAAGRAKRLVRGASQAKRDLRAALERKLILRELRRLRDILEKGPDEAYEDLKYELEDELDEELDDLGE